MYQVPVGVLTAELYGSVAAVGIIFGELGPVKGAKVLLGLATDRARGEPWTGLGPPEDDREFLSRRQIGPAVLLERNLRRVVSLERARRISSRIVLKASVEFLKRNVPAIEKRKIDRMSERQREDFVESINDKFFNADADVRMIGDEELRLTVKRCRFVELLESIGETGMSPLFCEGDGLFFEKHQPEIIFDRPEKLSEGGSICDFRFRFKK